MLAGTGQGIVILLAIFGASWALVIVAIAIEDRIKQNKQPVEPPKPQPQILLHPRGLVSPVEAHQYITARTCTAVG